MKKIQEKICKEHQRPLFLPDRRLLNEQNRLDNNLARLCLQSTKLDFIELNDSDVYIVWLTNDDQKEVESLNDINIRIFHSNNNLIDFISELQTSNVFIIIDYELVSNILSFLDDFSQIVFIYILTTEHGNSSPVVTDSKRSVRQICYSKTELFRLVIEDIDICTKDFIPSTIFDLTTLEESSNQSKNTSFIWYYLLIESLFDLNVYNDTAKTDLIEYCRQQYSPNNIAQQNFINEFENSYKPENAIRWYTRDSFIYRQLNKALRTRDIDAIFKFRFFIIDFQKQLEQHYNESPIQSLPLVYRGQGISELELTKLKNSVGKYISFNTYLSASIDESVALSYASGPSSVLFEIEANFAVDLKNKRVRPVCVQDKSYFPEEFEVIFPIGSTFLVNSVEIEDDRWNIKLKIIDDDGCHQIIESIQRIYMRKVPSKLKFANLLISLGDYQKAERYIEMLFEDLESSSDLVNLGYAYNLIGKIRQENGDYQCALSYFERALNKIESNNTYRAAIYLHLSDSCRNEGDYKIALDYLNQALTYKEAIDPLELADLYDAFGNLYIEMQDFDNALIYLNQALDIRQSNLSTHHSCSMTYGLLGLVYQAKADYTEAIQYFKHALTISSNILPKNHQDFISLYGLIGFVYIQCQNLSLAETYLQKALDLIKINEQKQNFQPIIYIFVCNAFAELYNCSMDITHAFHYAQKAYQVYNQYKNFIPIRDPMIRTIHSNLGEQYLKLRDYTTALDFFFKALDLSRDINNQIFTTSKIGKIYLDQGDTEMALHYLNEALELTSNTNRSNVDDRIVFWINSYMSDAYKNKNDFEKSILCLKEPLQLELDKANKNFVIIVQCYTQLMDLCPEQSKNYIEEILNISEKHDLSTSLKYYLYDTVGCHYFLQKDFSNARYYYELSLKYQLMCVPPCYVHLVNTYNTIGETYKWMNEEDSDRAFAYYEKSRDIYVQLCEMKEIPINDKQRMFLTAGCVVENIGQSTEMISTIISVYGSIARHYARKGNYEQALNNVQKMEQILNEYKGKKGLTAGDTIHSQIAFIYESIQHYDEAIFHFEKHYTCISNDYNEYGRTLLLIAKLYYDKGNFLMAISKCKISLTFLHNSKSIDHKQLGMSYCQASVSFNKINNGSYGFIYAEQAIQHFSLCIPPDYDFIISSYITGTSSLQSSKPWNYSDSLKYILTATKFIHYGLSDFSLQTLYSSIGVSYFLNKEYNNAVSNFKKALEYCKESDEIVQRYDQLRLAYILNGELDNAYDIVKQSINYQVNLKPVDFMKISNSYIDMGSVYEHLGNYNLALLCYQSAYDILQKYQNDRTHEFYSVIYNNIGRIYLKYGQVMDALNLCLTALRIYVLNKNDPYRPISIYINLGLIECKLENYFKSLDYFGQAWEFIFNQNLHYNILSRILYNHIGYVYFKLGQTEFAMKNYLKCLSLYNNSTTHPDLAQVYKNIGLIYEQDQTTYPTALTYYKRALEAVPNNKHPHYILYKSMIITLEKKMSRNKSIIDYFMILKRFFYSMSIFQIFAKHKAKK